VVAARVQGFFQNLTGGKKPDDGRPSVESMGLDYYDKDEVEHYFNYMGCLATEGTYDRMEALLTSGLHPANVILLLAAQENDTPKVCVWGGAWFWRQLLGGCSQSCNQEAVAGGQRCTQREGKLLSASPCT